MDAREIRQGILNKYRQVAISPAGAFKYPVGEDSALGLGYPAQLVAAVSRQIRDHFVGVGNPFALGPIRPDAAVLDLGCGAGFDACIAALAVGPNGMVVGCDLSPEMLAVAQRGQEKLGLTNISFMCTDVEELPFADASFDVVLSNGVLNLVQDKPNAVRKIFRVLKPGGRLQACDMSLVGETPPPERSPWSD